MRSWGFLQAAILVGVSTGGVGSRELSTVKTYTSTMAFYGQNLHTLPRKHGQNLHTIQVIRQVVKEQVVGTTTPVDKSPRNRTRERTSGEGGLTPL